MARQFSELIAWQLAREVKLRAYEVAKRPQVALDFDYVRQLRDAAASAPRNIAEGFGRFNRKEFSQYLKIAIASEQEVRNHFIDGLDREYLHQTELDAHLELTDRAIGAATKLRAYLLSSRNPYK